MKGKEWLPILLLIPSVAVAYVLSLIFGFFVANAHQSDDLGVLVMKWIFAVGASLPVLLYWKNIFFIVKNKALALLACLLLQVLAIGLFWLFISSI